MTDFQSSIMRGYIPPVDGNFTINYSQTTEHEIKNIKT